MHYVRLKLQHSNDPGLLIFIHYIVYRTGLREAAMLKAAMMLKQIQRSVWQMSYIPPQTKWTPYLFQNQFHYTLLLNSLVEHKVIETLPKRFLLSCVGSKSEIAAVKLPVISIEELQLLASMHYLQCRQTKELLRREELW